MPKTATPNTPKLLGRRALANDPACPLGVHAVAHALAESGRHRHGAQWMRDQHPQWADESRMRTHNAWHLAMFDVEDGNVASALGILEHWLLPASADSPLDACDAVALLWRLGTEGVGDEGRWSKVSEAFAHRDARILALCRFACRSRALDGRGAGSGATTRVCDRTHCAGQ